MSHMWAKGIKRFVMGCDLNAQLPAWVEGMVGEACYSEMDAKHTIRIDLFLH